MANLTTQSGRHLHAISRNALLVIKFLENYSYFYYKNIV